MTLSKARAMFIADLQGLKKSKSTLLNYGSDLARFAATLRSDSTLQFTPENVVAYFNSLSELSEATVVRKFRVLTHFAKWGTRRGIWVRDPMQLMGRMSQPKTLPRPFADDEVNALMKLELTPLDRVIRALLFYTGLRVSSIATIKIGDISFVPPQIRACVKGNKTQIIKMHPRLAEELKVYIRDHSNRLGQTFLLARDGLKHPRRDWIEAVTKRWGQAAKVADCTPHRFRHTFATRLLLATNNLRLVQNAMGHASVATTMVYTFITDQAEAEGVASLEFGS